MPQEVIEKYKDQVPAELLQIWQKMVIQELFLMDI